MARRLQKYVFEYSDSSSDELEPRRPRWFQERNSWFEIYDERDFATRFRLSKNAALLLLAEIEDQLNFHSARNFPVSPMDQLLIALRYYATGSSQITIGDYVGVSKPTVHRIVHRVSALIANLDHYLQFPDTEEGIRKEQVAFYNIARFPKVVGAMDCPHIKIRSPGGENAEVYRNRKVYFSINVQAICNTNLEFMDIVARWPGSTHDSTIFNNSYV